MYKNMMRYGSFEENKSLFTEIADKIIDEGHSDGPRKFYDERYRKSYKMKPTLYYGALPFNDGSFLAGPFKYDNGEYALISISTKPELQPFKEIEKDLMSSKPDLLYADYSARKKIDDFFGKNYSEYYFHKELKFSFSDIDIKYGSDELPSDYKKYVSDELMSKTTVFASTNKGISKIKSLLSEEDIISWNNNVFKSNSKVLEELRNTSICEERPYGLYLSGNDDAAWNKSFESLEDLYSLLDEILEGGHQVIFDKMSFS